MDCRTKSGNANCKKLMVAVFVFFMMAVIAFTGGACHTKTSHAVTKRLAGVKKMGMKKAMTVVKYKDHSRETMKDIPDVISLEKSDQIQNIKSYKVSYNQDTILSVLVMGMEQDGPGEGGYYIARFPMEGTRECLLAGLSARNLQTIQEQLTGLYVEGTPFTIEDLEFIDTEKSNQKGMEDSQHCWAAQTSNMLHYTGWGKKAGFETADDIMDEFSSSFVDDGGDSICGFGWFFNGIPFGITAAATNLKKENTGGFLPEYAYDELAYEHELCMNDNPGNGRYSCVELMDELEEKIAGGYGTGINMYHEGGGHAVAAFGLITNSAYKKTNRKHYESIIIADSDDDEIYGEDRRTAVNSYDIEPLKPSTFERYNSKTYLLPSYDMHFSEIDVLNTPSRCKPEKDTRATRNKKTTPDLCVVDNYVSTASDPRIRGEILEAGKSLHINPTMWNVSEVDASGDISLSITIQSENGTVISSEQFTRSVKILSEGTGLLSSECVMKGLEPGKYTVITEVNTDKKIREAYYINNKSKTEIEVAVPTKDISGCDFSVSVPELGDRFSTTGTVSYKGLKALEKEGFKLSLEMRYADWQDEWKEWLVMSSAKEDEPKGARSVKKNNASEDGNTSLPTEIYIESQGPKTEFRVRIEKEGEPARFLDSKVVPLQLRKVIPEVLTGLETDDFTRLPAGATGLAAGEEIRYRFVNVSTYESDPIQGSYRVFAFCLIKDGFEEIELEPFKEITLARGESTEIYTIKNWGKPLYGPTEIKVGFRMEKTDEESYVEEDMLADLHIAEKPSCVVTTDVDEQDAYDGQISLREAVDYTEETGETITFSDSVKTASLNVETPILITGNVSIDGCFKSRGYAYGVCINANTDCGIFEVQKGAKLSAQGLIFRSGSAAEGGAVMNYGGNIFLDKCNFYLNQAQEYGGVIYSKGGKVRIRRSVIRSNSSDAEGGVLYARDTEVHLLNCAVYGNSAYGNMIDTGNGKATIVASTICSNSVFAAGDVGAAKPVIDGEDLTLLGSVVALNSNSDGEVTDIPERVKAYGCCLGSFGKDLPTEWDSEVGTAAEVLRVDECGDIETESLFDQKADDPWGYDNSLFVNLAIRKHAGVWIREKDGKLQYAREKGKYVDTGIDAAFKNSSYTIDMLGNKRTNRYGCIEKVFVPYEDRVCAHTPVTLSNSRKNGLPMETKLGRAVVDSWLAMTGIDASMECVGELKGSIKKGDVTRRMIDKVLKSDITLTVSKLKGSQIRKILEDTIDYALKAKKKKKNDNRILQIGGMTVRYDKKKKKGNRITSLTIGGKKYKKNKKYRVLVKLSKTMKKTYKSVTKSTEATDFLPSDALTLFLNKSDKKIKKSVTKKRFIS